MTREEAITLIKAALKTMYLPKSKEYISDLGYALEMAIKALEQEPCEVSQGLVKDSRGFSQEPCEDVSKECYEDLCRYFGGAKDILKNREDFKAWLDRIKWHIHKVEELSAENDDLRDQLAMRDRFKQQPCEDAISRQAVIDGINRYFHDDYYQRTSIQDCRDCLIEDVIKKLPPVNPQNCDKCEVGNPCLYCRHEFEPQERSGEE